MQGTVIRLLENCRSPVAPTELRPGRLRDANLLPSRITFVPATSDELEDSDVSSHYIGICTTFNGSSLTLDRVSLT